MSSSTTTDAVHYVVYVPHDQSAVPRRIRVSDNAHVQDLEAGIRGDPTFKRHLIEKELTLLKCNKETILPTDSRYNRVSSWLRTHAESEKMEPTLRLEEYFPTGPAPMDDQKIHVVALTDTIIARLHLSLSSDHTRLDHFRESQPHHNAVTFKIRCEDSGSTKPNLVWDTVITFNEYLPQADVVSFVAVVVEKPRRAAENDTESAKHLLRCLESMLAHDQNQARTVRRLLSGDESDAPYARWNHEMIHYVHAVACVKSYSEKLAHGEEGALTKEQAGFIVLERFKVYWLREVEGAQCTSEAQFPFPLIAEAAKRNVSEFRKYRPKPDAAFLKHDFPRFLAEIDSTDNQKDKRRLLVQMACTLRLALALQPDQDFFVMGAFFTEQWEVCRYFVYAIDGKVRFHERKFLILDFSDLTTFLFEFYNYARHVRDKDTLGDRKEDIAGLVRTINAIVHKSLHTNATKKSKRRSLPGEGRDGTNNSPNQSPSKRIQTAMVVALRVAGFEVIDDYSEEELEPLVELPNHVVEGISRDGERIIAKLLRGNSEELALLRELSLRKSPHNHVVPLLDTVESSLGPLIIVPQATSLSIPCLFHGILVQLSRQLIEGVAFLHRQKIAHLDIKPSNLVYCSKSERLYIIDFDLAIQCKDVDEMVEISCGTPEWSAPEIVYDNNKPLREFSPIRADLWSCGKVLQFFMKESDKKDGDILLLINLLIDREPRRRPLLHDMVDEEADFWASGRLHQALVGRVGDEVRQTTMEGVVKLKRVRDDADGEGLSSKVPRQDPTASPALSSVSLLSSSPQLT